MSRVRVMDRVRVRFTFAGVWHEGAGGRGAARDRLSLETGPGLGLELRFAVGIAFE